MRILICSHHRYAGLGVFSAPVTAAAHHLVEWMPNESEPPPLDTIDAIVVLGGRARVTDEHAHPWLHAEKRIVRLALHSGTPVLGICLGAQVLASVSGGAVRCSHAPEIGWHEVRLGPAAGTDPLFGDLPERFSAFEWHYDQCLLPRNAIRLAHSATCLQAFKLRHSPAWGIQFHPEATRDDLGTWLDGWHADPRAVATGLDPEAIRRETTKEIERSNELGRAIIEPFLAYAAAWRSRRVTTQRAEPRS